MNKDNEVLINLEKFMNEKLEVILKDKLKLVLLKIEGDAKQNCPVEDGQLRASLANDIELEEGLLIGYVGSSLSYAPYVHQGTGIYALKGDGRKDTWYYRDEKGNFIRTNGQEPQPFLQDAVDTNREQITGYFKEVF